MVGLESPSPTGVGAGVTPLGNQNLRRGISVVVPVYNSEGSLPPLAERLEPVLRSLAPSYELILVDDGSRDRSWEVIQELARAHPWIRGMSMMRNYGQHNALLCGIREARCDVTVTMDDDLQHPPDQISLLLERLDAGTDVVYGRPRQERHGLLRDLASQITKMALQSTMGAATARGVSAFRVFRTELRRAFAHYQSPYVSIDVLLTWATTRFVSIPVEHHPRTIGVSNYTVGKLFAHAMNMMTGFSVRPLQIASVVGFSFTLFGVAMLVYVLGRYLLEGVVVPGFVHLASLTSIFSGAQMFALGIIGEYLARMHFRMMDRPMYAVRCLAGGEAEPGA